MRLLLTNDDGVEAPGLHALARTCVTLGHEVLVVAPTEDVSGAAAAVGRIRADERIGTRRATIPGLPNVPAHALAGPPGLAVMAACLGAFGPPPDAVASGINAGPNTGHAILHSGTVGAALTASTFGVSALAVSIEVSEPMQWGTACDVVEPALALLAAAPTGAVLNVNAPARPRGSVDGLRWARLDRFGLVRVAVVGAGDRWLQMEYRATRGELDPGSDTALLAAGHATVTAIEGIAEIPPHELPRWGADRKALRAFLTELPPSATGDREGADRASAGPAAGETH
jgi:5'-nucleotidase